jgi:hypothetical protein
LQWKIYNLVVVRIHQFVCKFKLVKLITLYSNGNCGSIEQQEKCKQLAVEFCSSRKRLLIREATCKENPIEPKLKSYMLCPGNHCAKIYQKKKSFHKHLVETHSYNSGLVCTCNLIILDFAASLILSAEKNFINLQDGCLSIFFTNLSK